MKSKKLTAQKYRIILIVLIVLLVLVVSGLATYAILEFKKIAEETKKTVNEAHYADDKNERAKQLARQLSTYKLEAERAQQVVAESKNYQYQNTIIRDLESIAQKAGVKILNFGFTATQEKSPTVASKASSDTANGASAPQQPAAPTVKSKIVEITISNPVEYKKLLNFIHYIEENITRMKIQRVTLSGSNDKDDAQTITSNSFTIEVFVR